MPRKQNGQAYNPDMKLPNFGESQNRRWRSGILRQTVVAVVAALAWCAVARGQEFEVASVKTTVRRMGAPPPSGGPGTSDPGQFTCAQITLWNLIQLAYGVELDQISGPDWIRSEWYTVTAKIPPNTSVADFRLMLQHLLAERFHLAVHHDVKQAPGFDLVVASGGPKIKPVPADSAEAPAPPQKMDENSFPSLPPGVPSRSMIFGDMVRSTHRETMAQFAADLAGLISTSSGSYPTPIAPRVVDRTELPGKYEFRLESAVSPDLQRVLAARTAGDPGAPQFSSEPGGGPTIFTAVEKQLGLKLVKTKSVPVDLLVIDRVDKVPTEN
jgi:uncharacterized protein (TIGR03435 family)